MGSRSFSYNVAAGPTAAQVEAAVAAFDDPDDAWAWALTDESDPAFPVRVVFEGVMARAFAQRAVPHLRRTFGVEVIDDHDHAMRFDPVYRDGVLAGAQARAS